MLAAVCAYQFRLSGMLHKHTCLVSLSAHRIDNSRSSCSQNVSFRGAQLLFWLYVCHLCPYWVSFVYMALNPLYIQRVSSHLYSVSASSRSCTCHPVFSKPVLSFYGSHSLMHPLHIELTLVRFIIVPLRQLLLPCVVLHHGCLLVNTSLVFTMGLSRICFIRQWLLVHGYYYRITWKFMKTRICSTFSFSICCCMECVVVNMIYQDPKYPLAS